VTTDTPTKRSFVVYTIADAVEKLVRIDRILQKQSLNAANEYSGVVRILQSSIAAFRKVLVDNAELIRGVLESKQLQDYEAIGLNTIQQNLIKALYGIHERLVFLPRERVKREVFSCLTELFESEWKSADGSVILTTLYNACEYRLLDVLGKNEVLEEKLPDIRKLQPFSPETSILELPIIDRDNPLSWPLLAHEFGHTLDRRHGVTKEILKRVTESVPVPPEMSEVITNWIAEIFADLVAGRVLGPVAMLPLFSLEVSLSTVIEGPSPLRARAELTWTFNRSSMKAGKFHSSL
jgi:hypothetical protein